MFTINTLPNPIKSIRCHFEDMNIEFNEGTEDIISLPDYTVCYQMDDNGVILLTQTKEREDKETVRITVTPDTLKNIEINASTGNILFNSLSSSPRTNIALAKGSVRVEKSNLEYLLLTGEKLNVSIRSSLFSGNITMNSSYARCFVEETKLDKLNVSSSTKGKVVLSKVESQYIKAHLNEGTCYMENTLAEGTKIITTGHGKIKIDAKSINDLYVRTEQGKIEINPDYEEGYRGLFLQTTVPIQGVLPSFGQDAKKTLHLQSKSGSVKLR